MNTGLLRSKREHTINELIEFYALEKGFITPAQDEADGITDSDYQYSPAPLEKLLANAPIHSFSDALRLTEGAKTLEEIESIFRRCTYEALSECPYGKKYTKDELVNRCTRIYARISRIVGKKLDNILEDAIKQRPRLVA